MKPSLTISFAHFWDDFDVHDNFFYRLLSKQYDVEISDHPDIVFFSVFQGQMPKGDYKRVFYTGENVRPDFSKCDWAFGFDYEENIGRENYLRLPITVVEGTIAPLLEKTPKRAHRQFCNFLYWKEVEWRERFYTRLSRYKHIDAPGRSMNNQRAFDDTILNRLKRYFQGKENSRKNTIKQSRKQPLWQQSKLGFLEKYKFTIAFENSSFPGYFTEKIVHPMIAGSIPIYWGNPEIEKDFNTKSFLNYHEHNSESEFIERIIQIDNKDDMYQEMLEEPWFTHNKKPDWANEDRILKRLIEIVEH